MNFRKLTKTIDTTEPFRSSLIKDQQRHYRDLQLGWTTGMGIDYQVAAKYLFRMEALYRLYKHDHASIHTLGLQIGVFYSWKPK